MIQEATRALLSGRSLDRAEARSVMEQICSAEATPVQVAGLLTALSMKGETPDEIAGMAEALRDRALEVPGSFGALLDTCGTGGDRSGTFNLSTTVAFLAASCGLRVAKHGNRSASSQCGSADVLEALGVAIELEPSHAARLLLEHGITFLFAPRYHPSLRPLAPIRRELGFPTVFNLLGPLCNPLRPSFHVLGVYRRDLVELMAGALRALGTKRALVVHGHGGLDELSLEGPSEVAELTEQGAILRHTLSPQDVGLSIAPLSALKGGDAPENARIIRGILGGTIQDARRDAVLWNAAAALWVGGAAPDLTAGVKRAAEAIDSGEAMRLLEVFAAASRR